MLDLDCLASATGPAGAEKRLPDCAIGTHMVDGQPGGELWEQLLGSSETADRLAPLGRALAHGRLGAAEGCPRPRNRNGLASALRKDRVRRASVVVRVATASLDHTSYTDQEGAGAGDH